MVLTKRPVVAARFELVSDYVDAGESYRHIVTVDRSGRARSVAICVGRDVQITPWSGAHTPTSDDLADVLITGCFDEYNESSTRLLSLVVHKLLPLGNHLRKMEVPDAVLDARLGFGYRTSYRADIHRDVLESLRLHPALVWAQHIQDAGTAESREFTAQVTSALDGDSAWLLATLRSARGGTGSRFSNLIAEVAPPVT